VDDPRSAGAGEPGHRLGCSARPSSANAIQERPARKYPGLCNTGAAPEGTMGQTCVLEGRSRHTHRAPGRNRLTEPAVSANYPDLSNSS